jgi:hypothetical protein
MGGELWTGEDAAAEFVRRTVDAADSTGRLRAILDTVRSHRLEDDFSGHWTYAREDFERKLYRKRAKVNAAETVAGQIVSVEYDGIEYGELSVNCSVIMVSHNISHPPWRVGHAGQASESRRQLVLAVALGARSAWSMPSGGGRVAGRARVDHGYVRARVAGKRKPSLAAAWRYGRCLERAARDHRGARDDEPGPSTGAGAAEGSGSSRRR